ncbi:hypothetical protein D3C73_1074840 [compost metagenome]
MLGRCLFKPFCIASTPRQHGLRPSGTEAAMSSVITGTERHPCLNLPFIRSTRLPLTASPMRPKPCAWPSASPPYYWNRTPNATVPAKCQPRSSICIPTAACGPSACPGSLAVRRCPTRCWRKSSRSSRRPIRPWGRFRKIIIACSKTSACRAPRSSRRISLAWRCKATALPTLCRRPAARTCRTFRPPSAGMATDTSSMDARATALARSTRTGWRCWRWMRSRRASCHLCRGVRRGW